MSRAQDAAEDAARHRKASTRQVRHAARTNLKSMVRDEDALEDIVLPTGRHDLGRKTSPKPPKAARPGRRQGFKVWKTPFWKRRRQLWAERNAAARDVPDTGEL
jgi:hypothetical protein